MLPSPLPFDHLRTQDPLVALGLRAVASALEIPLHWDRLERSLALWLRTLPESRVGALRALLEIDQESPRRLEETIADFDLDLELLDEDREHREAIGRVSEVLARGLGLSPGAAHHLGKAAELHDIGKVIVGQGADEGAHTWAGAVLLGSTAGFGGRLARQIALGHHEAWSGGGFPLGLGGTRVPLAARITRVAIQFVEGAAQRAAGGPPPAVDRGLDPTIVAVLVRERLAVLRAFVGPRGRRLGQGAARAAFRTA